MVEIRRLTGDGLAGALDDLARLRIEVFRAFPYLYDGSLAYERDYLDRYRTAESAIVVAAVDRGRIVGAATGMALTAADAEFKDAFDGTDVDPATVFYCAESVLLPEYRGRGLGHAFFDAREAHARAGGFGHSAFCAVIRPRDHPARPTVYRPLDAFWQGRGYAPLPGVLAHFDWTDLGEGAQSRKALQFWSRRL